MKRVTKHTGSHQTEPKHGFNSDILLLCDQIVQILSHENPIEGQYFKVQFLLGGKKKLPGKSPGRDKHKSRFEQAPGIEFQPVMKVTKFTVIFWDVFFAIRR